MSEQNQDSIVLAESIEIKKEDGEVAFSLSPEIVLIHQARADDGRHHVFYRTDDQYIDKTFDKYEDALAFADNVAKTLGQYWFVINHPDLPNRILVAEWE